MHATLGPGGALECGEASPFGFFSLALSAARIAALVFVSFLECGEHRRFGCLFLWMRRGIAALVFFFLSLSGTRAARCASL